MDQIARTKGGFAQCREPQWGIWYSAALPVVSEHSADMGRRIPKEGAPSAISAVTELIHNCAGNQMNPGLLTPAFLDTSRQDCLVPSLSAVICGSFSKHTENLSQTVLD